MKRSVTYSLVALLGAAVPVSAAPLIGTLGIAGSVTFVGCQFDGACGGAPAGPPSGQAILDFETSVPPPVTGSGPFFNVSSISGYFAGKVSLGSSGTILDLTNDPSAVGLSGPALYNLPSSDFLADWLSAFSTAAGLHFDLTGVPAQPGPACTTVPLGTNCSEGAFFLTQTTGGVRVDFDVLGNFVDGADSGAYQGSFSTTLTGFTLATVETALDTNATINCTDAVTGAAVPCSFDGNFTPISGVPEPATLLTFGAGSLVLARIRRRKSKKA